MKNNTLHLHISGAGKNVGIIQEAAAAEEAFIAGQLTHHLRCTGGVAVVHIVHRTHIVHSPACWNIIRIIIIIITISESLRGQYHTYLKDQRKA